MSQDLIKTNINIAGRIYPLKITKEEQILVANIEKQINTKIQNLQKSYPNMDVQDCMSMTIIKMSFDQQGVIPDTIIDRLTSIHNILSETD